MSAVADELFECVWPFCGVGAERVNNKTTHVYLCNEHEGREDSCEVATCDMTFLEKTKNQREKSCILIFQQMRTAKSQENISDCYQT